MEENPEKEKNRRSGCLFKWCRHAELNHELILTMDVYYHYTMPAGYFSCSVFCIPLLNACLYYKICRGIATP